MEEIETKDRDFRTFLGNCSRVWPVLVSYVILYPVRICSILACVHWLSYHPLCSFGIINYVPNPWPSWYPFTRLNQCLSRRSPKLDTATQSVSEVLNRIIFVNQWLYFFLYSWYVVSLCHKCMSLCNAQLVAQKDTAFSAKLLSSQLDWPFRMSCCEVLFWQDFAFGELQKVPISPFFPCIRSLRTAVQVSSECISCFPWFYIICELAERHFNPSLRLLIKTLNSTGFGMDPWGMLLIASCPLDSTPQIITLWA